MSITLPVVNLTGLVAGQTGRVLLTNLGMSANPSLVNKPATLRLHNDSGTGLLVSFKVTSGAFYLPAGGWVDVQIDAAESEIDYQVTYVLPGAPVTLLQIVYFAPNEQVPAMTQLGNSPIGVSGIVNVSTAQTLDNEGNVASTQWLKVIQSGGPASNFSATVDGNFQIEQWDGATLKNLFHTIPNAGANNSSLDLLASGLLGRVLGQLILANALPLLAFDSGAVARNFLQVDANNNAQLFGIQGRDLFQMLDHTGALKATVDLVNGILNIVGTSQSVNGDTTGTMTTHEAITGTGFKALLIEQNNYRQAAVGGKSITLKNAFTTFFIIVGWGVGGINFRSGGTAQNLVLGNGALSLSGAAIGNATQYQGVNIGGFFGACDTITDNGSYAGGHSGGVAVFGI